MFGLVSVMSWLHWSVIAGMCMSAIVGRWQAKTGFAPKSSLTRLQLAELLLEYYPKERDEALEHLGFAIAEFCDMKMQPSLERALRRKDIVEA